MPAFAFAGPVVGVVEDIHFASFREAIPPIVFHLSRFGAKFLVVRPHPNRLTGAITDLRETWESVEDEHPFAYEMLTDRIAARYGTDRRLARIVSIGAMVAIMPAGLGLFGLTAYMVERRRRELGVRKVLGATTSSILSLFVPDFWRWIAVALVIATPLAWIAFGRWLSTFACHTDIGIGPILLAGMPAPATALIAITAQALAAALAPPTASLRSE